jgi:alpha-L-rhamnosidase
MEARMKTRKISIAAALLLTLSLPGMAEGYRIYSPKVNGMTDPSGIEEAPVFSWRLASDQEGCDQTAYSILVKDADGKVVWSSGRISSSRPFGVAYGGSPLRTNGEYAWRVTSYGNGGEEAVSDWNLFSTGLPAEEWTARWIEITEDRKPVVHDDNPMAALFASMGGGPAQPYIPEQELDRCQYFRKEFGLGKKVKRAALYATAHGVYNLYVNGTCVSEVLAPGFTTYPHYLEYQRYDVTQQLVKGANVIGAIVADGWWSGKLGVTAIGNQYGDANGLLCQLIVEYEDGTKDTIGTDGSFRWSYGAYRYADLYEGESYDASLEPDGWKYTGFDDSGWKPVKEVTYDNTVLKGRLAPPVTVYRTVTPKRLYVSENGQTVLDVGENIVGRLQATLTGKKGQTVSFCHQEEVDSKGNVLVTLKGKHKEQITKYTFGADGTATYTPQFTFMGFRYVIIEGLSEGASVDDFKVEVLNTDMEVTGGFRTSDDRFNKLQENILRSQSGNMLSIPTDCPHREKAGWTGDMQIYAPTATYNMDVKAFLEKWLTSMRYDQREDGSILDVIPRMPYINQTCAAGWSDACVIVPWRLYEEYGDPSVLEVNYPMMSRWMEYVAAQAPEYLWETGFQYGDWSLPKTPEKYRSGGGFMGFGMDLGNKNVATAMYAYSASLMAKIASVLGKQEDSRKYADLLENIRKAYIDHYLGEDGRLAFDMQGLYTLTLAMDLTDDARRPLVQQHLLECIREMDGHLNTGFLSTPFLLDVLLGFDQEMARAILFDDEAPSWLYEVKMGATTLWESWMAIPEDHDSARASMNHFAYGCVGDFLYREILGLQKGSPAYETVVVDPCLMGGFDFVEGWHETPYGRVEVRWERNGNTIRMDILTPPSTKAVVHTPTGETTFKSGKHSITYSL